MSEDGWHLVEVLGVWIGSIGICIGSWLAVKQMRESTRQQMIANEQEKTKSLVKYYDTNRELIMAGFRHPELFRVLNGEEVDPETARRFNQQWINHFAVAHRFEQAKSFPADELESLKRDIQASLLRANLRDHWQQNDQYYPRAFQTFIDQLLPVEEKEKADTPGERPPHDAASLRDS